MDIKKVIDDLRSQYPNKKIFVTNEGEYQEIVCEIEPSSITPARSVAVAVVGKNKAHMHKVTTETYRVISGELTLYIDGIRYDLKEDEEITIEPGKLHQAEGNEAWFYVYSTPGWTPDDSYPAQYNG